MKKLDLYIIRKFLGTFFFAITIIVSIIIVFDVSEHIDDFIEKEASFRDVVLVFYFNFIPYFVNLFSALFTFIAVVFFTAKMASDTEIVAILSSGISFRRFLFPYLISAFIIAMMSFALANFVIPTANKNRLKFESKFLKHRNAGKGQDIHVQESPGTFAYVQHFYGDNNTGHKFTLEKFNEEGEMYYKLSSNMIEWDSLNESWIIRAYFIREIDGLNEKITTGAQIDTTLNLVPADFYSKVKNVEVMNYSELRKFINQEKLKGSKNVAFYQVEKHQRIAFPFATIILTLIGVALSSRKVRGGIGFQIAAGLLISFTFVLFMRISTTFATYGSLPPIIAVWIPNMIFGVLAVFLVNKAPK